MWREIKTFLRGRIAFGALLVFQLALLFLVYQYWNVFARQFAPDGNIAFASRRFFVSLVQGHLFFLIAASPLLMAPAVAGEQEKSTLTLLLSSPISNLHLVVAKWFTPILYLILLMTTSIPFLSIPFLGEGLSSHEVVTAYGLLITSTLMFGALGLFCSTLRPRVYEVYLIAVLSTLALALLIPYGASIWRFIKTLDWEPRASEGWVGLILSPFYALRCEMYQTPDNACLTLPSSWFGGQSLQISYVYLAHIAASFAVTALFLTLAAWRIRYLVYDYGSERVKPVEEEDDIVFVRGEDDVLNDSGLDRDAGLYLERRVQWFARWPVLFRLGYIALMISALTLPLASYKGSGLFLALPFMVAAFFTLPLAAASISSDRERETLDILLTTLLTPAQIVRAKFIANIQYSVLIALALFLPGICIQMIFGLILKYNVDLILQPSDLPAYLFYLVMLGLSLMLYTALGLYCSARFKKTNVAMTVSGVVIFVTLVTPFLIPSQALTALASVFGYIAAVVVLFLSPLSGVSLLFPEGRVVLLDKTMQGLRLSDGFTWFFIAMQCLICVGVTIWLLQKTRAVLDGRD